MPKSLITGGAGFIGSHIVDLLCDDVACPGIAGGVRLYRDAEGHLTATYLRSMTPYLAERLRASAGPG